METLFGTDGIRGIANTHPITPELLVKVGKAAALAFNNSEKKTRILIGKDTRLSGYMVENALTSGICSMGVDVLLVGPMPTPAISHLTKSFAADAGIMISASHNPAHHNGVKLYSSDGFKLSEAIEKKIERLVLGELKTEHINGAKIGKAFRIDDAKGRYIEFAKSSIKNNNLSGIKVVLDCANGAAYSIAPAILKELGAEVIVLNNRPDGLNINLNCGSLHPGVISQAVKKHKADIGIAFDGDADRVIMVDEKGSIVDGDYMMAIYALQSLKEGTLNKKTLVANKCSNFGLDRAVEKAGGKVLRVEVGEKYIVEALLNNSLNFGGEFSGHLIFLDFNSTSDGTIAALQILNIMKKTGKKLSQLASCMEKCPSILVNLPVKEKRDFSKMQAVSEEIKRAEKALEGKGEVYVRYSGTEKLARVMIHGTNKKEIEALARGIADKIKKEVGA